MLWEIARSAGARFSAILVRVNRRVSFLAFVLPFAVAALSATRFAAQSPQQPAQKPAPLAGSLPSSQQSPQPAKQPPPAQTPSAQAPASQAPTSPIPPPQNPTTLPPPPPVPTRATLSVVVLDPAHGGTDTGARGSGGLRESEVLLNFSTQVRKALESAGLRVIETRQGNDNPSFDDRAAIVNGQRGAIFISLHISSTGPPRTARVYIFAPPYEFSSTPSAFLPAAGAPNTLLSWDHAQIPFLGLSQHLAELTQAQLSQRFRGSPNTHLSAAVRQLRTIAAPAIAVELSSVSVDDRATLFEMAPRLAEGIARAVTSFRGHYDAALIPYFGGGT